MALTSDDFVTLVLEVGDLATNRYATSTILRFADEVILNRAGPLMRNVRGEYGVKTQDYTIAVGTANYRIPSRAGYGALHKVTYIDGAGNERPLPMPAATDRTRLISTSTNGIPVAYILEGDHIVLLPTPSEAATLRVKYYLRPSKLVPVTSCGVIDAIEQSSTSVLINVVSVPSGFPAQNGFGYFDVIQGNAGFDLFYMSQVGVRGDGTPDPTTTIRITATLDTELDAMVDVYGVAQAPVAYLCLAEQTPVIQLPQELHTAVARLTAASLVRSSGDNASADSLDDIGGRELQNAALGLSPRVDGEQPAHVQIDSPLRQRAWPGRYFPGTRGGW